jgi:hypothetical protein
MVKDIRITDPYLKQLIERVRRKSGESTPTRTASRLIVERLAQLELMDKSEVAKHQTDPVPAGT